MYMFFGFESHLGFFFLSLLSLMISCCERNCFEGEFSWEGLPLLVDVCWIFFGNLC